MESSPRTEGDISEERIKAIFRVLQAAKIVKQDNVPCKIEEGLYIGSLGAAYNKSALQSLNVTHILTVANSLVPAHPNDFTYLTIQEEARRIGGGVLVHCFAGKSRSATIIVAYLMFKNGVGLSEAFERVRSVRPVASPNRGFMSQLHLFEQSLRGTKTGRVAEENKGKNIILKVGEV